MPLPDSRAGRDPRLHSYRNRVAVLTNGQHLLGHLLVVTESTQPHRPRLLRRRSPGDPEVVTLHVQLLGSDQIRCRRLDREDLAAQLECWSHDRHRVGGEAYAIRWLDASISTRLASQLFDLAL